MLSIRESYVPPIHCRATVSVGSGPMGAGSLIAVPILGAVGAGVGALVGTIFDEPLMGAIIGGVGGALYAGFMG